MPECPICGNNVPSPKESVNFAGYDCSRCGRWSVQVESSSLAERLIRLVGEWEPRALRQRSRLSHLLRRQQPQLPSSSRWIELTLSDIERVAATDEPLPSPSEHLDRLILLVGDNQPSAGQSAALKAPSISAWIGATITHPASEAGLSWLLEQPTIDELVQKRGQQSEDLLLRLTMRGWLRYDELKRHHVASRKVLMAMEFGDEELNKVFSTCFVPAVRRTGFHLRRAIDDQPAGLIDDQLRVALRTSRFVIADLTRRNNGAYWEAGFAEGLGRPVIYTCKESAWKSGSSHFDTNRLTTVVWHPNDLDTAGVRLAATIRATLPEEAIIDD
jgi:hypothetical protein